jgi:hypothetical protein
MEHLSSTLRKERMKYALCDEAGLLIQTENGPVLNEEKFFRQMSYAEVLEFEFGATTIDRGQVIIEEVEAYLSKRLAKV